MYTVQECRLAEAKKLRKQEEELCSRLQLDPLYISSTVLPTLQQMEDIKVGEQHLME
jgi:hypothetical protein